MKESKAYFVFRIFNALILAVIVFATLFPYLNIIATSCSDKMAVLAGDVSFYPIDFNLVAYKHIIDQGSFWLGYKNTFVYTVLGTFIGLIMTIMCAYPLSKKNLPGAGIILKFIVFTMFFSGGLIPLYLLVVKLELVDTMWAMILPGCINAYNVIIMRTFFQGIPQDLDEAAQIDGMNQIGILVKIILPLSKPIIATMTLFIAVAIWNDWFTALIFLNEERLYPITLFLRNIVMGSLMAAKSGQQMDSTAGQTLPQTLQSATIVLVTVPILCVYPFIQKYFVKGIMIGSIKG